MASNILSFVACTTCTDLNRRGRLHVGLTDPTTLRVWCQSCDKLVFDFELAEPRELRCDICDAPITPGHSHH